MQVLITAYLSSMILSALFGIILIPILKKIKVGQPILQYVEKHKEKKGTPTMAGLFFIISACIIYFIFSRDDNRIANLSVIIALGYMVVGFLDDFIKVKFKKNEGLKAYQKIIFQSLIAFCAGYFAYINGLTTLYLPFINKMIDIKFWSIPLGFFIFMATTNSVNLTDGLDGLAGGVSEIYFILFSALLILQIKFNLVDVNLSSELGNLALLSLTVAGAIIGFLIFNVSPAKVFMGDTGSLALGGFVASMGFFSGNSFFIGICGIMFVLSSISVIIQVIVFKIKKKRVFLMAPIHHHFQMKGYSETQISLFYKIMTLIFGLLVIFFIF